MSLLIRNPYRQLLVGQLQRIKAVHSMIMDIDLERMDVDPEFMDIDQSAFEFMGSSEPMEVDEEWTNCIAMLTRIPRVVSSRSQAHYISSSRHYSFKSLTAPVSSASCAAPLRSRSLQTTQQRYLSANVLASARITQHTAIAPVLARNVMAGQLRYNSSAATASSPGQDVAQNANSGVKIQNAQVDENGKELAIDITEKAVKQLRHIATRDKNPLQALRIMVDSGGCHGYQYIMDLTDTINEDDVLFEKDGGRVIVDTITLPMISGSRIDFIEELIGSSFKVVNNPHAAHSCGCDTSFEIKI
ncbi:[4Fe-4S] proteins maturation [Lunasporangiospora selenospora]|uniref:[4Fe-4S] proteins maturation n=1 Tax=Lunasporangiospora selenospora TaxID=979761 RepID=A0A9P6G339_9FUNG|nr:[4Fe-4S] proteins maturation [Lunasporangiospora selenospora]